MAPEAGVAGSGIRIFEVVPNDERHVAGVVDVLDTYAREPVGGATPIAEDVRARLLAELAHVDNALILVAVDADERAVGTAVCFRSYSTFKARPLINIHDLAVVPGHRGRGIGHALLAAVEAHARATDCCKITLEVLQDNVGARRLYESVGFADGGPGAGDTTTLFMQKPL